MAFKDPERAKAYQRTWRAANPRNRLEYQRAWCKANPEKRKAYNRKHAAAHLALSRRRKYGWTSDMVEDALLTQGGICAIEGCDNIARDADHDHATGKPRAMLCGRCNTAIGKLEHLLTPAWQAYIERYK